MPRLSPIFERFLSAQSAGGPSVTREELAEGVRRASTEELRTFARQALDSIADGEIVTLLYDRVGRDQLPAPTNSLRDDGAGRAWLEGRIELRRGDAGEQNLRAIRTMQRALVKIGVHHPEGRNVGALLQLPWCADGALGNTTLTALNEAMRLAGRPDLAHLDANTVIGREVASTLEGLLARTTRLVFPGAINVPPAGPARNVVLFVGMGDHSRHEADQVKRALPAGTELAYVGDSSLGDDVIKVPQGAGSVVFDLKTEAGRERFVTTGFRPPLSADQQVAVREALEAQAWGIADARDEIAMMALELHRADSSNGRRKIPFLYVSGHSAGGGVWGDHNGELPMEALQKLAGAFPAAAATVEAPFFAACNHLHPANVEELMEIFPNMKHAAGYSAYAPGTWVGGIAQCLAWIQALNDGRDPITPELLHGKLDALRRGAGGDRNSPLFYANEKKHHLATWNASDSLYRWFEPGAAEGQWNARVKELRPDRAEIDARMRAVQELQGDFERMLAGTNPRAELRAMVPHGDNLACSFYERAVKLAGTMGLSEEQRTFATKWKGLGLRARYYGRILEKFTETFAPTIQAAQRELAAAGFAAKSAADLASPGLGRKAMLDYIDALGAKVRELEAGGRPAREAQVLHRELATRIGKLEDIPSSWL